MYNRLYDVLSGREDNYLLPFYWQHGDHYETIPDEVRRIHESGCRAMCVESRPHKDFCGEAWWRDMDLILSEAKKRDMQVWILDDDHFPTGHAVGVVNKYPEMRKWQLAERHVDVMGPVKDGALLVGETGPEHQLLGVYAYPRVANHPHGGDVESCLPQPIDLTRGVSGDFLQFTVPAGCWRIFFLFKTRQGSDHPDYIDMLREESVKLLIDTVYEAHWEHYAHYFGNTIAGFFSDEPSLGNTWYGPHSVDRGMYERRIGTPGLALPWNERIIPMMEEATGLPVQTLLPALWFPMGEHTGALRHAYMDAVTKLYRDCFTRQLGDWCESHGVQYIGHIIEDMNAHGRLGCSGGHYFRSLDGQHMSGMDIVLHQILPGFSDHIHSSTCFGNNQDPAFYDYVLTKLASSFAHIGTQTEDRAMCEVFGAYGWSEGSDCMKYLMDHLLVRGVNRFVPHAFSPSFPDPDCPPHFGANDADPQYEGFSRIMDYTNKAAHLLTGGVHQADAAIVYHAESEWYNAFGGAMLTQVPAKLLYDAHIDYDILPSDCFVPGSGSRVFPAQVKDGLLWVGNKHYQCLVVPGAEALHPALAEALDKLEAQGLPVFRMAMNDTAGILPRILAAIRPDISLQGDFPKLRCCHYAAESADIYMFVNESVSDGVSTRVTLHNARHSTGVRLDLLNDSFSALMLEDNSFPLELAPYQSQILIFDRELPEMPREKKWEPVQGPALSFTVHTAEYTAMHSFTLLEENVSHENLINITDIRRNPHFSGKIRYTASFRSDDARCIDLGAVGVTSRLWLNGRDLGVRVCPPYRYDLTDALCQGENELVIEVSNTLANAVKDFFSQYMPLPASGIQGPIRWYRDANC